MLLVQTKRQKYSLQVDLSTPRRRVEIPEACISRSNYTHASCKIFSKFQPTRGTSASRMGQVGAASGRNLRKRQRTSSGIAGDDRRNEEVRLKNNTGCEHILMAYDRCNATQLDSENCD